MPIEWTEDLATGIEVIDNQHKELFARVNSLIKASSEGENRENLRDLQEYLQSYVVRHFSEEEKYMEKYHYPDYALHREEHIKVSTKIKEIGEDLEKEGINVHNMLQIYNTAGTLIRDHVKKVDKKMAAFIKDRMESAERKPKRF